MFRTLFFACLLSLTAHPVLAGGMLPKQEEDPKHPKTLRIHFGSPGHGIDRETFQKAVSAAEAEMNNFATYSLLGWGKEGEQTICIEPKFADTFDSYQKFYQMLADEGEHVGVEVLRAPCLLQHEL